MGSSLPVGQSPKNVKKNSQKIKKEIEVDTKMEKVPEEASQEVVSDEEEEEVANAGNIDEKYMV